MSTHLVSVVIDAADPAAQARWWSEALVWPISFEEDDEVVVEPLGPELEDRVPALVFVSVPDAKAAKNRVHLDLASEDAADRDADRRPPRRRRCHPGRRRPDRRGVLGRPRRPRGQRVLRAAGRR